MVDAFVIAALSRDAPTKHCLPEDNALLHNSTSTADAGSRVPNTGPVVDEENSATADTSARAADRVWPFECK